MPRIKPTTTYTPRVKPSNTYTRPRESWQVEYITFDSTDITFDSLDFTFDMTQIGSESIATWYTRPRYSSYVEDITGTNVFDLSWELVQWISGNQVNKIDTVYT